MRSLNRTFRRLFLAAAAAVAGATGLSSCGNLVNDDLDPCPEGVQLRFVYDYNMEYANAFPSQVDCLTLLVYDEQGNYIETRTETSEALLSDENWRMNVDLPAGKYHLVAYGGMACQESSFHFVETPEPGSLLGNLQVSLDSDIMEKRVGTNLHPLFYGAVDVEVLPETVAYEPYTINMMKDTNNLRIVLQELNGDPLDGNDFNFEIIDNNTLMNSENLLVPRSEPFTWRAWDKGTAIAGFSKAEELRVAYGELSFGRLWATYANSGDPAYYDPENPPTEESAYYPILSITYNSPEKAEVVRLPLISYLKLLMSSADRMTLQEYLDRQSRWSMIFFLDEHWKWVRVNIEVEGWTVRINNPNLAK